MKRSNAPSRVNKKKAAQTRCRRNARETRLRSQYVAFSSCFVGWFFAPLFENACMFQKIEKLMAVLAIKKDGARCGARRAQVSAGGALQR